MFYLVTKRLKLRGRLQVGNNATGTINFHGMKASFPEVDTFVKVEQTQSLTWHEWSNCLGAWLLLKSPRTFDIIPDAKICNLIYLIQFDKGAELRVSASNKLRQWLDFDSEVSVYRTSFRWGVVKRASDTKGLETVRLVIVVPLFNPLFNLSSLAVVDVYAVQETFNHDANTPPLRQPLV